MIWSLEPLSGFLRHRSRQSVSPPITASRQSRPTAAATVVKILPSSDVLPANHLKFYIYFSAPMRGGRDIFDQICILDAQGNEIRDPWPAR